ncbi:hypothetical protein [Lysinibacillus contaminans]|uniref:hypothetical protein n=1 Tax=Lysinibacillus contaminans TaxID=1293441 RepID=UPI0006AF4DCA|nr:hypothetical protein [Lysinibacillus contaminans]
MNEIKRQLQMKIGDTTQQQRNVIRKINAQHPTRSKKKYVFIPATVSLALLVATCLFVFSFKGVGEPSTSTMHAVPTPLEEEQVDTFESNEVLTLTEEQKRQYHQQYVEIIEKAMEKKIGISIGVSPMEEFKESDWVEPQVFEKRIQAGVDAFLATEREKLAAMSTNLKPAVTNPNGETMKARYLYFSDILINIGVTATFDTQYNSEKDRLLFSEVDAISTKLVNHRGTWDQTFQQATILDGGRTYRIYIEGIFNYNGLTFEKAFTIEFHCDEFGKIY